MPAPTNPYREPGPWGEVKIGGRLIVAHLVAIDGAEIEDEYNVQRPIGQSGAVAVFKGTKIAELITLTFEGYDEASFDDLWTLWEMMRPVPGTGGGTGTPKGSQFYQAPTKGQVDGTTQQLPPGSGLPTNTTADGWPKNATASPNPGPRPPTLTIENPALAWIGVTAISRKKWKGPYWRAEVGSWRVDLTVIQAKPPTPANVGAQPPAGAQYAGAAQSKDGAASNASAAKADAMGSPV